MICRFKAGLLNSKVFMREYELRAETSLYEFHDFLLNDLSFAPDQMIVFRGSKQQGKVDSEYGLFDMGDGAIDSVSIQDVLDKGENVLDYVFDLFKNRYLILSYLGEIEEQPRVSYPRLVAEKGRDPEQFVRINDDYDAYEVTISGQSAEEDSPPESFMEDELPEGEEIK